MSTRDPQTSSYGADGNGSRRDQQFINRDPGAFTSATTITFTAPNTITDSGNSFTWAKNSGWLEVRGSAGNSRVYNTVTASAGTLTVTPSVITSESSGVPIIMFSNI